jgi:glycosyltransferase involved in cell wall biosynthesis
VSVLLDIQGIQSPAHSERGIARYVLNLAAELERRHQHLLAGYLLNPSLAVPGVLEPMLGTGRVAYSDRVEPPGGGVYHIGSPIEYVPLEQLLPRFTRTGGMSVVVTLYDLIPKLFPDVYLLDAVTRGWYGMRLQLVQQADRILTISESTARDAIEQLGVSPDRVVVVGAGVSERFERPASRTETLGRLREELPWLKAGFVLYTGGIEPRKNIDRLLVAYAGLPEEVRRRHQLVIVCRVSPRDRAALGKRLRKLGAADRVHFPGFVEDAQLVRLYQACELFVFPSLYEGYGLPIAEAMACGAPVISSRTSSLTELVQNDEALFDPREPESIRAALERVLTDESLRRRLGAVELDEGHTWAGVADRTAAVYEELLRKPPRIRRARKRIALVSPLPPARSGIADETARLLAALSEHCDIDAFADQDEAEVPHGVPFAHVRQFDAANRARGGYDRIVVCLGNSEHHAEALALIRRHPAIVIAHDVRLTGLYGWLAANRPDLEPHGFHAALHAMYDGRLPAALGAQGWLGLEEYDRYGILMAREVLSVAERYLVHSRFAADLARLEASPGDEKKIAVLPFGIRAPEEFAGYERSDGSRVIATFGIVGPTKQPDVVLEAFARLAEREPQAELAFVGPVEQSEARRLAERAAALGVGDRVRLTGELDEDEFQASIARASVAVQLRSASNGETSAAVTLCLAAGVPTVVSAIGFARELPDDCVVKVERDAGPDTVAEAIGALLRDHSLRSGLRAAGVRFARENSYEHAAEVLYQEILRA